MINVKLDKLFSELRSGKREGSIITNQTCGSLSADDKDAWHELRRELATVGITPTVANQHRELIKERVLQAIAEGDMPDAESSGHVHEVDMPYVESLDRVDEGAMPDDDVKDYNDEGTSVEATSASSEEEASQNDVENKRPKSTLLAGFVSFEGIRRIRGAFHTAKRSGDDLKRLPDEVKYPNLRNAQGVTPLILAIQGVRVETALRILHSKAVDVNATNSDGRTALMMAIAHHPAIMRATGHDEFRDESRLAIKHLAVSYPTNPIFEFLIEQESINVNARSVDRGQTALHYAANQMDATLIKRLLKFTSIDVNIKNKDGHTAVMLASLWRKYTSLIALLGDSRVDVNTKDDDGDTLLMITAWKNPIEVVEWVLKREDLDLNATNNEGRTALIESARCGYHEVVEMLLRTGAHRELAIDKRGYTALDWAKENRSEKVVDLLYRFGATTSHRAFLQ